jgi:hypothetical protein
MLTTIPGGRLTIPSSILLLMLLIIIGGMFSGFNYSRAAGFFTMAIFGAALLMLVAYLNIMSN